MFNLHIINETFTNGYSDINLNFISLIAILLGILVIITKNPIISVLFLIGLFLSISCYLILLGMNFIGLSYLLVYIGAVSILFLFILMLINVRVSELLTDNNNSIPLAIIVATSFNNIFYNILPYSLLSYNISNYNFIYRLYKVINSLNTDKVPYLSFGIWDGNLWENSHITSLGNVIYTNYSIWLILTSIILLLAMVGSIVITIKPTK